MPLALGFVMGFLINPLPAEAACDGCTTFAGGKAWGTIALNSLSEASGLAASQRNPGVVWVHNDGSRQLIYAFNSSGERLASYEFNQKVDDTEDIAVGVGPVDGVSYLYVGDIGGNQGSDTVRSKVKILRIPEPAVDLAWASNPRSPSFEGVESFTLVYPDGSYDAETLMVDPISGDVLIATKQERGARLYRANLTEVPNESTVTLEYAGSVQVNLASGGDITADGLQIVLRREEFAMTWGRCPEATVSETLAAVGQLIPVMGPPVEPNGEGIAWMPDGSGYLTVSEGKNPVLYFFQSQCPAAPKFTLSPTNQSAFVGGSATFRSLAVGYPTPGYQWNFNGQPLPGETNSFIVLSDLGPGQMGTYQVVASNANGTIAHSVELSVRSKPDLRITEAMSSLAPSPDVPTADWWELTSFESQPVDLSGWRFNENSGDLADPFVLPAGLVINPGESMIFVEDLTAIQFRNWWGDLNVPSNLQIVTYTGSGLSLGAGGDGIRLWDAQTGDAADVVARVDFGTATAGVSFGYDPLSAQFGGLSQLGANGVLRAVLTADLGSPGRVRAAANAPVTQASLMAGKTRIAFDAEAGFRYSLETLTSLESAAWEPTGDVIQPATSGGAFFEKDTAGAQHFYRVVVE